MKRRQRGLCVTGAPIVHPRPRRLPPPQPLPRAGEFPENATSAEGLDPVWIDLLRTEGFAAVQQRIAALRASDDNNDNTNRNGEQR